VAISAKRLLRDVGERRDGRLPAMAGVDRVGKVMV
jgi:hypothetical protein